jgi:hypothetical protein
VDELPESIEELLDDVDEDEEFEVLPLLTDCDPRDGCKHYKRHCQKRVSDICRCAYVHACIHTYILVRTCIRTCMRTYAYR